MREVDLLRAANVQLLGVRGPNRQAPTLRQLASLTGDPWAGILRDHHDALTGLVAEIEVVSHQAADRPAARHPAGRRRPGGRRRGHPAPTRDRT